MTSPHLKADKDLLKEDQNKLYQVLEDYIPSGVVKTKIKLEPGCMDTT